jgi:hypothetical protein
MKGWFKNKFGRSESHSDLKQYLPNYHIDSAATNTYMIDEESVEGSSRHSSMAAEVEALSMKYKMQ